MKDIQKEYDHNTDKYDNNYHFTMQDGSNQEYQQQESQDNDDNKDDDDQSKQAQ
ncbi:hypothetical protein TTHERM_001549939 (macronuclear) [Tetrahymena thermophila SB210]|uniref:Uncharacterized protein n=1 Tax=Tetrahymena thermophila (strain SB210) TaxID=312017 RepID=W7XGJ9_TETTS|nr:hypothetical protein TTHERM_001549939 [Tetrahymena thermophila SB210]EWS76133.1 hypothetical protein TTHERM_001549939 [Tetrahymena thermophila SB210]|eukprot:XP_012651333.1 hypothetical protein TTHERM_001549939 [Tetrahymena thermophila SB210]